jgi:hypothetical protein
LSDALGRARELTPEAIQSLHAVQQAATAEAARSVVAKVAQTNETLAQVFEDAARCEGADENERVSTDGDNTVTLVVTDSDPSTAPGFGETPGTPIAIDAPTITPPPPTMQTIDTIDPVVDMPIDMPPVPPTASPMR